MACISDCSQSKRFTGFEHLHLVHCRLKLAGAVQCSFGGKATFNGLLLFGHHHSIRQSAEFCICIFTILYLYLNNLVFRCGRNSCTYHCDLVGYRFVGPSHRVPRLYDVIFFWKILPRQELLMRYHLLTNIPPVSHWLNQWLIVSDFPSLTLSAIVTGVLGGVWGVVWKMSGGCLGSVHCPEGV